MSGSPQETMVGIDVGTTNTCVSFYFPPKKSATEETRSKGSSTASVSSTSFGNARALPLDRKQPSSLLLPSKIKIVCVRCDASAPLPPILTSAVSPFEFFPCSSSFSDLAPASSSTSSSSPSATYTLHDVALSPPSASSSLSLPLPHRFFALCGFDVDRAPSLGGTSLTSFKRVIGEVAVSSDATSSSPPKSCSALTSRVPFRTVARSPDPGDDAAKLPYIVVSAAELDAAGDLLSFLDVEAPARVFHLLYLRYVQSLIASFFKVVPPSGDVGPRTKRGVKEQQQEPLSCVLTCPAAASPSYRQILSSNALYPLPQPFSSSHTLFSTVQVLSESVAAAVPYGLDVSGALRPEGRHLLLVDVGGGTTDVALVFASKQQQQQQQQRNHQLAAAATSNAAQYYCATNAAFELKGSAGDNRLGGDDVDYLIVDWFLNELPSAEREELEVDISAMSQLKNIAERAKILLSGTPSSSEPGSNLRSFADSQSIDMSDPIPPSTTADVSFRGHTFLLSQSTFQSLLAPFISAVSSTVSSALSSASLPPSSIDEVVVVGGSSSLPLLLQSLALSFPQLLSRAAERGETLSDPSKALCTIHDPKCCVSVGAAMIAAVFSNRLKSWELANFTMLDVVPHDLGLVVKNPMQDGGIVGENEESLDVFLKAGSPLPAMEKKVFSLVSNDQKGVTLVLGQDVGEVGRFELVRECTFLLARLTPETLRGMESRGERRRVEVQIEVTANREISVGVFDPLDVEACEKRRRAGMSTVLQSEDEEGALGGGKYETVNNERFLWTCLVLLVVIWIGARLCFHEIAVEHDGGGGAEGTENWEETLTYLGSGDGSSGGGRRSSSDGGDDEF